MSYSQYFTIQRFRGWLWLFLPLCYLWFRLIDNLRIEWTTNPQYSFGWVVPLLCVGLLIRRWETLPKESLSAISPPKSHKLVYATFFALAFLYLPIRLLEAATPEWRPIQWALAVVAIGISLCAIYFSKGRGWLQQFAFPICFFLVAIPWPTLIEAPIIQSLTRANAAVVVEVMGALDIPAIQHGNLIEVGTGTVGIDEACSGIRSFQSALMISLFLGEFYRLVILRRLLLVPIAFLLAFLFNVVRTSFLTWIAAKKGVAAIATYHDPAGLVILLGCIAGTWGVSLLLTKKSKSARPIDLDLSAEVSAQKLSSKSIVKEGSISASEPTSRSLAEGGPVLDPVHRPVHRSPGEGGSPLPPSNLKSQISNNRLLPIALGLIVWLVAVEMSVQSWYYVRESRTSKGPNWAMNFPVDNPTFKAVAITETTLGLLQYDEGKEGTWTQEGGIQNHVFYFNWFPGRVSGYLAKRHTPEICFGATGRPLVSGPDLTFVNIHGLVLPMRQYLFGSKEQPIHVFHCRWEAGVDQTSAVQFESARFNLFRGIWAGRGKNGQKVIEFVITGIDSPEQAKAVLVRQLEALIKVEAETAAKRN